MRNPRYLWIVATFVVLLLPAVSYADTVVAGTFGSGQSFQTSAGWSVYYNSGCGTACFQNVASSFTPTGTFTLTQIDVAASGLSGTNQIGVELLSDASGAPGSVLESWTLTNVPSYGSSFTPEALAAVSPITLSAGTTYWVELVSLSSNPTVWNYSPSIMGSTDVLGNATGPNWVADSNQFVPAYDVLGTAAVPEPSTLLLFGVGLLSLAGMVLLRTHLA
jgi:PEP-CTERM motif